jgi:plastocyanin
MKRRHFFERFGVGTAAMLAVPAAWRVQPLGAQHQHAQLDGPLANAVVSFGQWLTDPPLDRFPNVPPAPPRNQHLLLPREATIKAGGGVTFLISGLHQILVYADGTGPEQIDTTLLTATTGVPAGVPLINDPGNRIYRGPDPSLLGTLDRVETVTFAQPGRYFVMCGLLPHFNDGMYGFVKVI